MTKAIALFLAILMIAVPLAGCTGDDSVSTGDDTELNVANERIVELEAQAEVDQARIVELEDDNQKMLETTANQAVIINELQGLCCTSEEMENEWYDGYDLGKEVGAASSGASTSTLDIIMNRGSMKCGVKESQYGMGYLDAGTGVRSGLDIDYCRAIAAAIGLDPHTDVEYIPASGSDRFDKLASGTIDVLIRTTTWTTSRDADLNADFAGMNFFDGQGILVREDAFPAELVGNSAAGLHGANICVGIGTTTEGNMVDWFSSRDISFTSVPVSDAAEATAKFIDGSCDAFTGDMSAMVAKKWQLDGDASMGGVDIWIAQELLSKEPLAAVTRDYDSEWNEIVGWVWWGMITAEEMGVTSTNYASMASDACSPSEGGWGASDPSMCRLLTENLGLGTTENPLAGDWMQAVLATAGNYGEAYDDAFCDGTYDGVSGSVAMSGCLISRVGTLNALVSEGGLQYAPPMR
jgi:general L-amino acid transport system substrate-binding protein